MSTGWPWWPTRPPMRRSLARFTRRALGPVGTEVPATGRAGAGAHEERCAAATELASGMLRGGVAVAVALGPGAAATVRCVAADG